MSPPQNEFRISVPRSSFAVAMKDYPFVRPGIAVTISALCLVAALVVGGILIGSLRRASAMVDYARKSAFTLHDYNAALDTWHQLVTREDPELQKPESRALRDSIRTALMGQLNQMAASTGDTSQKNLIATVVRGLQSMNVGLDDAARQSMIVMLARQDDAMFQAIASSQRAVLLSALLIGFTIIAAGSMVVPMAWLYIRYKQGNQVQQVKA
jgi:hypothetical protein